MLGKIKKNKVEIAALAITIFNTILIKKNIKQIKRIKEGKDIILFK